MKSSPLVREIYNLLRSVFPKQTVKIYGRQYSSELFNFTVKDPGRLQFLRKSICTGHGTMFGLIGKTVELVNAPGELVVGFRKLGFQIT